MAITTFVEFKGLLDQFILVSRIPIDASPHGALWRVDYNTFITGNVPNVVPATRLCVPRSPGESGVYLALAGLPPFDDTTFPRMPPGGPFLANADVQAIFEWITNGCPE